MTGLLRKRWHASSSVLRAVSLSVPSSSISRYLPTWTALMPWWPICSSALRTVLPCGSTTAFLGVMMIFAFILAHRNFAENVSWKRVKNGFAKAVLRRNALEMLIGFVLVLLLVLVLELRTTPG